MEYGNRMSEGYELNHHGVKGMKWGVRKKPQESAIAANVRKTKAAYRSASRAYSKSFNKADAGSIAVFSPFKKHREANDARWDDAVKKAKAVNKAEAAYKAAKKTRKTAIEKTANELERQASFKDKLIYNSATRKKAAKYVVDNNMSVSEATKKAKTDALVNGAAFFATYAAITVASRYIRNR